MASERCTSVNYSRITIRGQPTTCRIHAPRLPGINNPRIYGILDRFVRKDAFIVDRIARIPLPRHYFNTVIRVSVTFEFHCFSFLFSFFLFPSFDWFFGWYSRHWILNGYNAIFNAIVRVNYRDWLLHLNKLFKFILVQSSVKIRIISRF